MTQAHTANPGEGPDPGIGAVDRGHFGLAEIIATARQMTASGHAESSIELYQQWLRRNPDDPLGYVACFDQGALLLQTGQPERAVLAYAEAIRHAPSCLPAYVNMGLALERLGRCDEAVEYWRRVADCVVPVDGGSLGQKTLALRQLSRVFANRGDLQQAEEALRRCLDIDPYQRDVIAVLVDLRQKQCEWPVIAPWGKLALSSLMAALSPLSLAIHTDDPVYQLANAWRSYSEVPGPAPCTVGRWCPPGRGPRPTRPLRIGYLSPDLRDHAIGSLTAELFELHDRARVDVFVYNTSGERSDSLQARIRPTVDHWNDVAGWSDKQVARQIVGDEIDVLIDLAGHSAPNAVFALRPAPIIVNWLGYPGSMGTPYHQYIIADETIIPPTYEKYYSERVMRLPCYQPTDRKRIVARSPSRAEAQLADGAFVYCCFNGTKKITPRMFRSWMAILGRVPRAVLWLLSCDAATDERLRQQAARHGISPDRLVFAALKPHAEHLARYRLVDLFLDTWPYGAHTTASDALWMGVPVLTMIGHSFASRVCASLVSAAGIGELVCGSPDAYEDHAVELATQPHMLAALGGRLRDGRDHCTLFDMPLLVTRLEALYERMWNGYLADEIPEPNLANFSLYNEIGDRLDHEASQVFEPQAYERIYTGALAYYDSISPVPADGRLWAGRGA